MKSDRYMTSSKCSRVTYIWSIYLSVDIPEIVVPIMIPLIDLMILIWFLVFNATFRNIPAMSWRPVLVVEETGIPGENHRPWAINWFLDRRLLQTRRLLNQGFLLVKMKSSLRKCCGRHHDLVDRYGIFVSQMTTDMFHLSWTLPGPFLI